MKIKPLFDNVVIQTVKPAEQTSFGLVLPGSKKSAEAIIVAIGNGSILESGHYGEMQVKVGDHVILRENIQGEDIDADGEKFKIVSQNNILAIIE